MGKRKTLVAVEEPMVAVEYEPPPPTTLEWKGETFEVASQVSSMAFMRFAKAAETGLDSEDYDGLVAQYDLLRACLTDESFARFEQRALKIRATGDECFELVHLTIAARAGRPTVRPSASSDGSQTTPPTSTDDSLHRVIDRIAPPGQRGDLKLAVYQSAQSRAASA